MPFLPFGVIISANKGAEDVGGRRCEERVLEEQVKLILYAYPLLRKAGTEYGEVIKNKGILSYKNRNSTESVLEEMANLIITQRKLVWLKEKVDEAVLGLTETEKLLVGIRYFRDKKAEKLWKEKKEYQTWSERKYFRMQERLLKKLVALFRFVGIDEELFREEYEGIDIFKRAKAFLQKREEKKEP